MAVGFGLFFLLSFFLWVWKKQIPEQVLNVSEPHHMCKKHCIDDM